MSDLDHIRVIIDGSASDLRRATREAVRDIRDVAQEVRRASAETKLSNVQTDRAATSYRRMGTEVDGTAQHLRNFGVSLKAIAWGSAIAGAAPLAAGIADIGAGAVAATTALAPLAGSVAALPGLFAAAGQGLGVMGLAFDGLGKAMHGNKKALEELTPAARQFLMTLRNDLGPEIRKLRATAQADLFPGLLKGLKAAEPALRPLNKIVADTARQIGTLGHRFGELVGSKAWTKDLATLGARNVKVIGNLGDAGIHMADALRNVVLAAGPLVDWMTRAADATAKNFDQWTKGARASGQLADFFKLVRERITQTVDVLKNLGTTIFNVFSAANPLAGALMKGLVAATGQLAALTSSVQGKNALRQFFDNAKAPLEAVGKLIAALGGALADLAGKGQGPLKQLADTLRIDILPVLHGVLSALTTTILPHLITLLGAVGKLMQAILPGLAPLLGLLAKILQFLTSIVDKVTEITQGLPGVAKLIPTLAVTGAVLGSWKSLVALSRAVVFGSAGAGVGFGAAGAGAGVGAAAQSARNFRVLTAATAGGGVSGFLARGGLRGLATRLLPRIASKAPIIGGAVTVGEALGFPDKTGVGLPNFKKQIDDVTSTHPKVMNMVKALDALAGNWHTLAFEASGPDAKKMADAAGSLTAGIQPARNLLSAIQTLASSGGKSMDLIRTDFKNAIHEIGVAQQAGVISAQQASTETSQAYGALAAAILAHMKKAGKYTQAGMDQITQAVQHEFSILGISLSAKQAQRYGTGNDTLTGKPLSGGFAGAGKATGGYIGAPGEAGADNVPVVLGRGEAVLNRHQQGPVNAALQMAYGTDLGGLFSSVQRPHYMASGGFAGLHPGIAAAAGKVLARFPQLAITSTTGGQHAPGSYHYLGEAADIAGPGMDAAAAWIRSAMGGGLTEGIHNPNLSIKFGHDVPPSFWGASTWAGHANHIHLAVAGALRAAGLKGGGGSIGRVKFPSGMGLLSALGQGALDKVRGAANRKLASSIGGIGGGGADSGSAGVTAGHFGKGKLGALWVGAGGPSPMSNLMAAIALAESGGDPNAHNASGASGLWQILGQIVKGNIYNPHVNAENAVAKWRSQGLGAWTTYTSGAYRKYMARGGFVGQRMASGGYPTATAAGIGDSIIGLGEPLPSSKTKTKKKAKGRAPAKATTGVNPNTGKIESHTPAVWHTIHVAYTRKRFIKSHMPSLKIGKGEGYIPGAVSGLGSYTDNSNVNGSADLTFNEQAFLDFFDGQLAMADLDTPFLAFDPTLAGDTPFDPVTGLPAIHNPAELDDDLLWSGRKVTLLSAIYADRKARHAPVVIQGRIASMVKAARGDLAALQALRDAKQVATPADTSVRDGLLATQRDNALANLALSNQQFGVLSGFAPLIAARFAGSFARGTMSVPRDGLAMVHQGEAILPNPRGPYGNQTTAAAASNTHNIEVHVHGDGMDALVRKVDVLVDGKIQRAQHAQGRRARLFASAPGGR